MSLRIVNVGDFDVNIIGCFYSIRMQVTFYFMLRRTDCPRSIRSEVYLID